MIVQKHGMLASARVKQSLPAATRVIVARTDGIALYDDESLAARDGAAALTAATLGVAVTTTVGFALGATDIAVLKAEAGHLVVAPVDGNYLLAVVLDKDADPFADAVHAVVRAEADRLRVFSGAARVSA